MIFKFKNSYFFEVTRSFLRNFIILLLLYAATRVIFIIYNLDFFPDLHNEKIIKAIVGATLFDISSIIYFNIPYILLLFSPMPSRIRTTRSYSKMLKWSYILPNAIGLIINTFDTIYFPFTQRRTSLSIFREFENESNIFSIVLKGIVNYWPITLSAIVIVAALFYFYSSLRLSLLPDSKRTYWFRSLIMFLFVLIFSVLGVRGGLRYNMKALNTTNAFQYISYPANAPVILNTPFTLIQSVNGKTMPDFHFYASENEASNYIRTEFYPSFKSPMRKLNVVVIMMEGFSSAYSGLLNKSIIGDDYKGYTPFLDSLMAKSLIFESSIANGTKSIDVLPSVLASVPHIVEPYILGQYSNDKISSLAGDLKKEGYYSAFFHGAENGSLGLWNFAQKSGFDDYFGKNEYGNDADFDGTWAIWDKEFFEFYAQKMNTFKQPFITAFFSATSHNPFVIPQRYKSRFKEGSMPIYKCISYSDFALQSFFEKAKKSSWFKNTLFVICADHTSTNDIRQHQNSMGRKSIPIVFYYPAGIKPEVRKEIVQQIDIKPSVLGFLGYNKPYVAFGRDVFHSTPNEAFGLFENNFVYEYLTKDYLLQFNGEKVMGLYLYNKDRNLENNLIYVKKSFADSLARRIKGALQMYQYRLKNNKLTIN